jgi:hypothetical protein
MNEKLIIDLTNVATVVCRDADPANAIPAYQIKFNMVLAELMVGEFIDVLEREIELCEQYKATSCNDFDRRWQEGKIQHFHKLIDKTKKHFGVESCTN